jgi:hypothetical protein
MGTVSDGIGRCESIPEPGCDRAVHMEEVHGQHARGLGTEEPPPGRIRMPKRRRRYPPTLEDSAYCRSADTMAKFEQLALDPLVTPHWVLAGHPLDQRGDRLVDRWAPRSLRASPLADDQTAMPAQHCGRSNQPVATHRRRQQPDQPGQDCAVSPIQARLGRGSTKHTNLVAQHQQLDVLGRRATAKQQQPTAQPTEDQVEHP